MFGKIIHNVVIEGNTLSIASSYYSSTVIDFNLLTSSKVKYVFLELFLSLKPYHNIISNKILQ